MGRDTRGVRGVDLRDEDFVIGMDVVEDDAQQVLAVSVHGYGKRTPITEWRLQGRGGKGIIAMVTSERNGDLVKLRLVRPGEQIMVVTNGGQIIRTHIDQIREAGRSTQGVRVIRVAEGEQVVDVEPLTEEDEGDDDALPMDSELPDASVAEIEASEMARAAERRDEEE